MILACASCTRQQPNGELHQDYKQLQKIQKYLRRGADVQRRHRLEDCITREHGPIGWVKVLLRWIYGVRWGHW
jgi:hypothetical protein